MPFFFGGGRFGYLLGGGFKYYLNFHSVFGEDVQFDEHILADALVQPPTSYLVFPSQLPQKRSCQMLTAFENASNGKAVDGAASAKDFGTRSFQKQFVPRQELNS